GAALGNFLPENTWRPGLQPGLWQDDVCRRGGIMSYQQEIQEEISGPSIPGALAENTTNAPLRALIAEVNVPCGLAVCIGSSDNKAKLPTSAAEVAKCVGVAIYLPLRKELPAGADYAQGDHLLYLEKGEIFVAVEGAVTAGEQAYVRFAANGELKQKGAFCADASLSAGTPTAAKLPGSRYTSSTTGAGIAKVRLNLPASAALPEGEEGGILYFDENGELAILPIG